MSCLKSPVCDYFPFLRYRWLNLNSILIICDTKLYSNSSGYVAWGLLISLQPPFYPSEAEKKGDNSFFYQYLNFLLYVSSNYCNLKKALSTHRCRRGGWEKWQVMFPIISFVKSVVDKNEIKYYPMDPSPAMDFYFYSQHLTTSLLMLQWKQKF